MTARPFLLEVDQTCRAIATGLSAPSSLSRPMRSALRARDTRREAPRRWLLGPMLLGHRVTGLREGSKCTLTGTGRCDTHWHPWWS